MIWEHNLPRDRKNNVVSPGKFLHWRDLNQSFEDMAALSMPLAVTMTGNGEPEQVLGWWGISLLRAFVADRLPPRRCAARPRAARTRGPRP